MRIVVHGVYHQCVGGGISYLFLSSFILQFIIIETFYNGWNRFRSHYLSKIVISVDLIR